MLLRKKQGFTLIELIMVIVILGILAAVALPRFVNLQKQAKTAAAEGDLAALRSAAVTYYASTAVRGTASYPGTKAILTALLDQGPATLPADSVTGDYAWKYTAAAGKVDKSGTAGWQ